MTTAQRARARRQTLGCPRTVRCERPWLQILVFRGRRPQPRALLQTPADALLRSFCDRRTDTRTTLHFAPAFVANFAAVSRPHSLISSPFPCLSMPCLSNARSVLAIRRSARLSPDSRANCAIRLT
jgi:hypothetical protein